MTPAVTVDLAWFEPAARKLCRSRGVDPDERVMYSDGTGHLVARFRPAWQSAARELEQFVLLRDAAKDIQSPTT